MGVVKCKDVCARVCVCFRSGPFRNFDCFNLTLVTPPLSTHHIPIPFQLSFPNCWWTFMHKAMEKNAE